MALHSIRCRFAICGLSAILISASAAAAQLAAPASKDGDQLAEVQVVASKLDKHTLNRVAMKFVESHAAVSPVIQQLGRWRASLCPYVTGLTPKAGAFVSSHVEEVAQNVGAPIRGIGKKCAPNVEIVFTAEPQELLNHIAKAYPMLLGSSRSAGDTTFRPAIQAWYLSGTRSVEGFQPLADPQAEAAFIGGPDPLEMEIQMALGPKTAAGGAHPDPAYGAGFAPFGRSGSYLTKGLTSELLHVLVIVDTGKVATHSLRSIADYIAMLALTRMGPLDACSELPSITDLLSSGCGEREKPSALTGADTAYLKALYSSDPEANLNVEEGDMRDRMVKVIAGK